jgi:hypothetical protein
MSASERWRRKKGGESDSKDENRQQVTELTELANRVLTRTGNMNIYQESYEHIAKVVGITLSLLVGRGVSVWVIICTIICQRYSCVETGTHSFLKLILYLECGLLKAKQQCMVSIWNSDCLVFCLCVIARRMILLQFPLHHCYLLLLRHSSLAWFRGTAN